MNDTKRLDWLEKHQGYGLISDDCGHWAVSTSGFQSVPRIPPGDLDTHFWVYKNQWKTSIREAIDAAIAEEEEDAQADAETGD